jgi:hypothetical protein
MTKKIIIDSIQLQYVEMQFTKAIKSSNEMKISIKKKKKKLKHTIRLINS